MRLKAPFGLGTWLKPTPADDSRAAQFAVPAAASVTHGSADDDSAAIRPFRPRLFPGWGGGVDDVPNGYIPSYGPFHGPHFRVGYQGYAGVQQYDVQHSSEGDSTIGRATRIRPPLIPRATASRGSVRDAIVFVASQPNNWGVVQPTATRR